MKKILFGIVFIAPPFLKKIILKWFCGARFGRGAHIGWFSSVFGAKIELGEFATVRPLTLIRCDGEVRIGSYTEISSFSVIYGCSNFQVGNKCYIGPQTWINVSEDVVLGNGVGIGPRTMIFTHGSFLPYTEGYPVRFGKVIIGNNVWIAAGVFIHPDVQIGDNVLINSRSVIKKSIRSGQYVEGFPAKEIIPIEKIRFHITPAVKDELILDILVHFISFLKRRNVKIIAAYDENHLINLRYQGRDYIIILVNSKGTLFDLQQYRNKNIIVLLNITNWSLPNIVNRMLIFDFTTMKTSYSRDKVHNELYQFMKMYYGMIFEYD